MKRIRSNGSYEINVIKKKDREIFCFNPLDNIALSGMRLMDGRLQSYIERAELDFLKLFKSKKYYSSCLRYKINLVDGASHNQTAATPFVILNTKKEAKDFFDMSWSIYYRELKALLESSGDYDGAELLNFSFEVSKCDLN